MTTRAAASTSRSIKPSSTKPSSMKPQSARLEARISHDLHAVVKRAAEMQGRTMTDFVIHALQSAASQAIEQAAQSA